MIKRIVSLLAIISLPAAFSLPAMASGYETEIQARQDAYSGIKDNVEAVGEMLENGEFDYSKLAEHGEALTKFSSSLKGLFPEGSQDGSNAKKAVWQNPDKFSAGLSKLEQGFDQFYNAAKAQDQAALVAGFKDATGTCKACHRKFRHKK